MKMKIHSYIFSLLACLVIALPRLFTELTETKHLFAPLFTDWNMKSKQGSASAVQPRSRCLSKSVRLTATTQRWLSASEEK